MRSQGANHAAAHTTSAPGARRWWTALAPLAAITAVGLPAMGCAADSSHRAVTGARAATGTPAVTYARCMRENGAPDFPDPVDGRIQLRPETGVDPDSPEFHVAEKACRSLAPHRPGSRARARTPRANGRRDWPAFAAWLRQRAAAREFSGAVLVASDGKPLFKQADGFADRKRMAANTLATRFNIGSVGKTFTAVAIAQLVQRHKLSFDDPIGKYVSGFPAAIADHVTIAQLLTHTSGLGDVFMRWHPTAPSPLGVPSLMKRIVDEPLRFAPGSRFGYGNSGYVVLGAIIESVTGQRYYEYVHTHVYKPAGMEHTGWYTHDQAPNMAHGYVPLKRPGKPPRLRDSHGAGGAGNPSGGAYSTAGDLLRFTRALQRHELLSAVMTRTVLTGKVDTGRPGLAQVSKYGYGFEDELLDGVRIVGHGGGAPGIEAQLRIYPTLGYTAIILANQDAAAMAVYDHINEMLTGHPRRPRR